MTDKPDKLCLDSYQSKYACIPYFYNIFNDIRYYFNQYKSNEFNTEIDKIGDPILRHIALYLVENYYASKIYFSTDGECKNNLACASLNKWLDNKKSYFTHALHCQGNVQLWNRTIEPIWNKLEEKSKNNKWCKRHNFFKGELQLPEELNSPICYKHVPKGYECVLPFPPTMENLVNTCKKGNVKSYYTKCKTKINQNVDSDFTKMFSKAIANGESPFKNINDVTFSRQVQKHCECSSFDYAIRISVCLSFLGTVLILFLLKKFTPLGSKLSYRGINKKRLRDNFNEELKYEEYARSMKKNPHRGRRRNNIYYHSSSN